MDLVLNDEQRMIRDGATQLFRERGGVGRLRALRDGKGEAGREVWRQIAELGWLGMTVPERAGGVGLGLAEMCLVAEAAGRVLAPEPLAGYQLAVDVLLGAGVPVRERWLAPLLAGQIFAAVAWEEREMRGDVGRTSASARGVEGGHVIDGAKCDVIAAAGADILIVSARVTEGDEKIALFLVDPKAEGVRVTPQRRIDSLPAARIELAGVKVLGKIGGEGELRRALDRATVVLAAELLGASAAAFDMTLAYLRERQQFGVAIGTFQALRHRAARMYIGLELGRSATMAAARMLDAQTAGHADGKNQVAVAQAVSLAKARVSDTALHVMDEAVQMHGGIGVTDEHDIGLFFKRARVAAMTFGDGAFHRDRWARLGGY